MTDIRRFVVPAQVDAVAQEEEREREAFLRTLDSGVEISEDLDNPVNLDVFLDHYLAELAARQEAIARNGEIAQRRVAMIEAWLREANHGHEREALWLRQQIEAFARGYDYGRKKSRSLPNGTFGTRAGTDTLEIVDMVAAVAFAKTHGLEVKESVNKTPLLDYFKSNNGVVPDGCEFVEGQEKFFIKVG